MDDQELLDCVEQELFYAMLDGASTLDHLGYTDYAPGTWAVTLNANTVARLLDMAKGKCVMPVQERNFCQRCGKRTADLAAIHTCTPPRTHDSRILFEDHPTDPDKVILRKPKHEDDDIQDYKRSWVGLTDEERRVLWKKDSDMWGDEMTYAEAIEAKLKEKNT